jgi:glucose-6-phosphate isomerase
VEPILLTPFTVMVDQVSGVIAPDSRIVRRSRSDMAGAYLEVASGEDIIYEVFNVDVPQTNANLQTCTTTLHPGRVGREFYMTKGHFHEIRDRAEIYFCVAGEGRLVMALEDGTTEVEPMTPGSMNYIPGGWSHRTVNVGEEPLIFLAAYIGDSGHDYGTIEKRGFPVLVVAGESGPEILPNPRYHAT